MPVRIQDLPLTGTISESLALMEISDPSQSPSSRRAPLATAFAGPYAAAAAASAAAGVVAGNLVTEQNTRAAFDAQFATAISTANGCAAIAAGPTGGDLVDNTNSEVRIARLGPKAWNIQALSLFGSGTEITGGAAMEWFFNVPATGSAGPFKDLYDAILGATYYPCGNRSWRYSSATLTWSASVRAGVGSGAGTQGFYIKMDSGYLWTSTSTPADIISQLSLRMNGMVILP